MTLVLALVVLSAQSESFECIRLDGDERAVRVLRERLDVGPPCRSIEVRVSLRNGAYLLERRGHHPRSVSTLRVAESLLESWSERRLVAQLLAPRDAVVANEPPPRWVASPAIVVKPLADSPLVDDVEAVVETPPIRTSSSAAVMAPGSVPRSTPQPVATARPAVVTAPIVVGSDRTPSRWGGAVRLEGALGERTAASAAVAARLDYAWGNARPWVGLRGHLAPRVTDDENTARRSGVDALAGVDLRTRALGFVVAPRLAIGVAFLRTDRTKPRPERCTPAVCDALDRALIDDEFSATSFGPRLELGVGVSRPITTNLALDVGLDVGWIPMANTFGAVPAYAKDADTKTQAVLALPPESRFQLRLGIGVRWGAP